MALSRRQYPLRVVGVATLDKDVLDSDFCRLASALVQKVICEGPTPGPTDHRRGCLRLGS